MVLGSDGIAREFASSCGYGVGRVGGCEGRADALRYPLRYLIGPSAVRRATLLGLGAHLERAWIVSKQGMDDRDHPAEGVALADLDWAVAQRRSKVASQLGNGFRD